jgi:2-polyprenyl-3-methyl-5-hydroxy-6-metoxy-1,4-benzoquinol methylase
VARDASARQHGGTEVTMTTPRFDQDFWERLWAKTLREHGDKVSRRPPNAHLTAEVSGLPAGRALDAGCGHGADTLWLAAHGWRVTAVDFSAAALAHGRATAEAAGADIAARVEWIEGDLAAWAPAPGRYDLVVCLYVHVAGSVEDMVRRMADAVAPGGTLLLVGHRPVDPATGAATAAASQVQVSVEAAVAALDAEAWALIVAEERPRAVAGTGVDAVIHARRREDGLMDAIALLGRRFPEVAAGLRHTGVRPVYEELEPGDAQAYCVKAEDGAWEMSLGDGHVVETIFLYPDRGAALPRGLRADFGRFEVLAALGRPDRAGAEDASGPFGPTGGWDRYDGERYCLHVQYAFGGDGLALVTLMLPSVAP